MAEHTPGRGKILLDAIYDDVDSRLNPDDVDCWHCGGDGETHDCIDGCCDCADYGCDDCRRPCQECAIHAGNRAKAVRIRVIESGDPDLVVAWLKSVGRWHDGISTTQIASELEAARAANSALGADASTEGGVDA